MPCRKQRCFDVGAHPDSTHGVRRRQMKKRRLLGGAQRLLAVGVLMVASAVTFVPSAASAAEAGTPPNWFPLRGDHLIGCAYNGLGSICKGNYHPYWAIDIKASRGETVYAAGKGKVV